FARELRVWARLSHPHILSLLGYYLDQDRKKAILVSDYMSNGDLKEYIEDKNPSWNVRLELARDIADGLSYLHTRAPFICHGDLKMGNILVSAQLRAVLADFGLSTILEEEGTGMTTSTGLKGTVRYYSPELILEADVKHSLQSDIWAWGCLILEVGISLDHSWKVRSRPAYLPAPGSNRYNPICRKENRPRCMARISK
ncbi:hypothetical protein M407DRAFT_71521, partial [Tulasnella calospora MUT 4182]